MRDFILKYQILLSLPNKTKNQHNQHGAHYVLYYAHVHLRFHDNVLQERQPDDRDRGSQTRVISFHLGGIRGLEAIAGLDKGRQDMSN